MVAPENGGSVTCTDEFNYGSVCSFECLTGFNLVGAASVTCGAGNVHGGYDAGAPQCEGK